jgi:hypothetical protein
LNRSHISILHCLAAGGILAVTACSGIDPTVLNDILTASTGVQEAPLDEATVGLGLREALVLGTERAVQRVSQPNGYLADELLRITLPEELQKVAGTLRQIGLSKQVEELEVAMNRAAEKAATEAVDVFGNAVRSMSFADAFGILRGGERAATDYFYDRTQDELRRRFQPVIRQKMQEVGLYRIYDRFLATYQALPFDKPPVVNLDTYLTSRALDGLFTALADEEAKIRRDPIARTTELLRKVFGRRG